MLVSKPPNGGNLPISAQGEIGQVEPSTKSSKAKVCIPVAHQDLGAVVQSQIRAGTKIYERKRDLPALLHLFPSEIENLDRASVTAVLKKLTSAVRGERERGRTRHWRYSLARHIGLMQALSAEKKRMEESPRSG